MAAYLVRESLLDERARVDSRAAQGSPGGGSESTLHDVMCEVEEEGMGISEEKQSTPQLLLSK
jgi:hypothetical protein